MSHSAGLKLRSVFANLAPSVAALIVASIVGLLVIAMAGHSPFEAARIMLEAGFGDRHAVTESLLKAVPLLFTGLAVTVAFRAGIWNIGADGQFMIGALAATYLGVHIQWTSPVAAFVSMSLAAFLAGSLWSGVASALREWRHVSEVISTIMLNLIALQLVSFMVHGPLQEAAGTYPQSDRLPEMVRLARWIPGTRLHSGFFLGLFLCVGVWLLLFRTAPGFRIRAIGQNPEAARYAGMSVRRTAVTAMLLSGGLAGLGGYVEIAGVTYRLYENISPGYGFTAIAVALLGRLHPLAMIPAALLFGGLESATRALQRTMGISPVLAEIIQALVILIVVGFESRRVRQWLAKWTVFFRQP